MPKQDGAEPDDGWQEEGCDGCCDGKREPDPTSMEKFFQDWDAGLAEMQAHAPAVLRGFGGMFQALMKEGALSVREKELVALGIALALRCIPCINLHVQKCLKAGADRGQILEAAGVAVMMQGGPAFTHVPEVIRALDHLEEPEAGHGH